MSEQSMVERVREAIRYEIDSQNGWSGTIDFAPIANAAIEALAGRFDINSMSLDVNARFCARSLEQ